MLFLILIFPLCTCMEGYRAKLIECSKRDDCPRGFFCYTSGYCASCTNCNLYYREFTKHCAEDPQECGPCLPGYEEALYIGNKVKDACALITQTTTASTITKSNESSNLLIYVLGPAVLMLLFLLIMYCCLHRKDSNYQQKNNGFMMKKAIEKIMKKKTAADVGINADNNPSAPFLHPMDHPTVQAPREAPAEAHEAMLSHMQQQPFVQPYYIPQLDNSSALKDHEKTHTTLCKSRPFNTGSSTYSNSPPPVYSFENSESDINQEAEGSTSAPPPMNDSRTSPSQSSPHVNEGSISPPSHTTNNAQNKTNNQILENHNNNIIVFVSSPIDIPVRL